MSGINVTAVQSITEMSNSAIAMAERFVAVNPFVCLTWLRGYERELLKPNETPLYVIVTDAGEPQIILPLVIEASAFVGIRKIRGMSNFYTNVYSPITSFKLTSDEETLVNYTDAICKYLANNYPSVAMLELAPLRGAGRIYSPLAASLERHGYRTRRFFATKNWYEPFDSAPNFAAYLADRPGALRSTLKRKTRVLQRETVHSVDISRTPEGVESAMADFEIVYRESWKPEESYPSFIANTFSKLARENKVMIGILYVDKQPAAAQIWLKIGDHWAVFKLAYRPSYAKYSVGSILTATMIEECLSMADTRCIDFLSGDDNYKADWVTHSAPHWGLEAINMNSVWGRALCLKRSLISSPQNSVDPELPGQPF